MYTDLADEDRNHIKFALAYWWVVDLGHPDREPMWPLADPWLHTEMSAIALLDREVAIVHVLNRFPQVRRHIDYNKVSVIAAAATVQKTRDWTNDFQPNLAEKNVSDLACFLEWPEWIQARSDLLEQHTFAVFNPGEIWVKRALTDEFAGQTRTMAIFYEIIGEELVAAVLPPLCGIVPHLTK